MEQLPALANSIAFGMGVSRRDLLGMAEQRKLSARVIYSALTSPLADIPEIHGLKFIGKVTPEEAASMLGAGGRNTKAGSFLWAIIVGLLPAIFTDFDPVGIALGISLAAFFYQWARG